MTEDIELGRRIREALIRHVGWDNHIDHGLDPVSVRLEGEKQVHDVEGTGCGTCGYGAREETTGWETTLEVECTCGKWLHKELDGQEIAQFLSAL